MNLLDREMAMMVRDLRDMRGGVTRQLVAQDQEIAGIKAELAAFKTEVKADLAEVKADMATFKAEVRADMAGL